MPNHLLLFRIFLLTFFILISPAGAFSQSPDFRDAFYDDFNDNQNLWISRKDNPEKFFLRGGKFHLRYKENDNGILFSRYIYVDPKQDYEIETHFSFTEIGDSTWFGLAFGGHFFQRGYLFWVQPNGKWTIRLYFDGVNKTLTGGQTGQNFALGDRVRLRILNRDRQVDFFVGEERVLRTYARRAFGAEYGLMIYNNGAVAVDDFRIGHPRYDMRLVHDFDDYEVERLPAPINTYIWDEIAPVISPDGQTLYYAKDERSSSKTDLDQDIWRAHAQGETWTHPEKLGPPLNNDGNNFVFSVREDHNQLLLGNLYQANGEPDGEGISLSRRQGDEWGVPEEINTPDWVNEDHQVSYCLSSDGKTLLFSAEMSGNYGESDLYLCHLQSDGSWSEPVNLGPDINTWGDEADIFLAADNRTLYFSAYGSYPGYGGFDIYVSHRLGDGWQRWTHPQNLGPKVNTRRDELHFSITSDGRYAYFNRKVSQSDPEDGSLDIFRMKLKEEPESVRITTPDFKTHPPEPISAEEWGEAQPTPPQNRGSRPEPLAIVRGRVLEAGSGKPLQAGIRYSHLNSEASEGRVISDPKTGKYSLTLSLGQLHGLAAEASGYLPLEDHIDLRSSRDTVLYIERDLYLQKLEEGVKVDLKNVFFVRGKAELLPASLPALQRVVALMRQYPGMLIHLTGHTDNKGDAGRLQALSERRMEAVREYLIDQGIRGDRIDGEGKGGTEPAFPNDTERNRRKNRRVSFRIDKM